MMVELKALAPEADFVRLIVGAYLNFYVHTSVAAAGGDPERVVKASRVQIERLDDIVFREGGSNIELLDRIRAILGSHVNALLNPGLSVVWPTPGTVIDEDAHNALGHGGGRVKIAESAIVRDGNGKVLTRARVQVM